MAGWDWSKIRVCNTCGGWWPRDFTECRYCHDTKLSPPLPELPPRECREPGKWNWSTIRWCNSCGALMAGDATACPCCKGRNLTFPAAPAAPKPASVPQKYQAASSTAAAAAKPSPPPQKPQPAAQPKPQPAPVVQAAPGPIGPAAAAEHFRWVPAATLMWAVLWAVPAAISALSLLGVLPYGKLSDSFLGSTWVYVMIAYNIGCVVTAPCQGRGMTEFGKSKVKAVYADAAYTDAYESAFLCMGGGFFVVVIGFIIGAFIYAGLAPPQRPLGHAVFGVLFLGVSGLFLSMWQLRIGQACGMAAASWGHASVEERAKQVVRDLRVLVVEALGFPAIGLVLLLRLRGSLWLWVVALVFELFFVYCLVRLTSLVRMTANALSGYAAGRP